MHPLSNQSDFSFENALKELNALSKQMEQSNLSLEESMTLWKTGVTLTELLDQFLTQVKKDLDVVHQYGRLISEHGDKNTPPIPQWVSEENSEKLISFEAIFNSLQQTVSRLETGSVEAHELIPLVKDGFAQAAFALRHLNESELVIEVIEKKIN
jgi:exodeoxyribonuclease VII small subunit